MATLLHLPLVPHLDLPLRHPNLQILYNTRHPKLQILYFLRRRGILGLHLSSQNDLSLSIVPYSLIFHPPRRLIDMSDFSEPQS